MTILGISIGTKETGVCVLQGNQLIDKEVHFYPRVWSAYKLRLITNKYKQYLIRYPVDTIVVKVPPSRNHTAAIRQIIKRIEHLATAYQCSFDLITKAELKDRTNTHSTAELIAYAVQVYPELAAQRTKGYATQHLYDKKMYEAIIAAHVVQQWMLHK